jgi:two-component system nitrate/nitrite response regulator NarL
VTPSTVYVCDSQPILVEGIRCVLSKTEEFRLIGASQNVAVALEEIPELQPSLVLLDHGLGWREIHQFVEEVKLRSRETKSVVWGQDMSSSDCYRSLQAGVRGAFRRTLPVSTLLECLRETAAGRVWMEQSEDKALPDSRQPAGGLRLTPREREIVRLVARGMKNREIAGELIITTGTVKVHLMHVFEKTGVKDRYELAVEARNLLAAKVESL